MIAGYPLVHRLGPRHDDQPRRPHAAHRARRTRRAPSCGRSRTTCATASCPNLFPEGEREGLYHTADATLWFFHALDALRARVRRPAPRCSGCCRRCSTSSSTTCAGTRFGIGVDPADRLLRQGAEGYQLTWMDAKVDDWVVTPRRGKAVEINALWYNALRVLARLARAVGATRRGAVRYASGPSACRGRSTSGSGTRPVATCTTSSTASRATTRRAGRTSCSRSRCRTRCSTAGAGASVVDVVARELLTPVGLRTLAPGHPDYKRAVRRRPACARRGVSPGHGLGVADRPVRRCVAAGASRTTSPARGECSRASSRTWTRRASDRSARSSTPRRRTAPRGCVAQAWSVAELLRVSVRLASVPGSGSASG